MRPELRKLMVLPTPRWTAAALIGVMLTATIAVVIFGPGDEDLAVNFGLAVPSLIAAIVIGVWMPGLEYGQKTMRRTLTRNPNRLDVVFGKLGVVLLATLALTVVPVLIGAPLFALAASLHDGSIPIGDTLRGGLGSIFQNLLYAAAGFSFGLVTRSMAGGMTIALAYFFVIDSLLTEIPKLGDFMLSAVSGEVYEKIVGDELAGTDLEVHLVRAVVVTVLWLAVFLGLSSARFLRTDID